MCGICGLIYTDPERAVSPALLENMAAAIFHRGPDEDGMLCRGPVGLAMRRLKIIDLTTGSQPIVNEDGCIAIVYNGEIYNFLELRRELEVAGHQFRTNTDTEVVVHAYEQYGLDFVRRLNGMFAFALWDEHQRRLVLARDRSGQKPLFYHLNRERLVFASEIKALLQSGDIERQINPQSIYHYLSLQYVPGPETIFQGIMQLPAGHMGVWEGGHLTVSSYWKPEYEPKREMSEQDWCAETRQVVTQAIERHLVSDVPLGAFLSGGVDSSIVVAAMSRVAGERVKTFSIGFDVSEYNEIEHARRIANRFHTDHHEFIVSPVEVTSALPDVVWASDQPLADPSCLATYHLARLTRQHVTVALTGDGGDEAFAGYIRYWLDRLLAVYQRLPEKLRLRAIPKFTSFLTERADIPTDRNFVAGVKRLAQASSTTPKASILAWGSFFTEQQKTWLAEPNWLAQAASQDTTALLAGYYDDALARTRLDRTLSADFLTYLADDLLVKSDRMAMANSLETRAPFLDNQIIALCAGMPERMKIRGRTQKWILREAFKEEIPPENVRRIKRGFGMPVASWLRGHMQSFAREILLDTQTLHRGYFVPQHVQQLLDDHTTGRADHGQRLWALLVLELWHRKFVDA
jgi:asparagine synthase (glutamine-hydrolysing)